MVEATGPLVMVVTTLGDAAAADRLVRALVEERLIACGNILPGVTSIYRWAGEVTREGEVIVLMKTTKVRLEELLARAAALHPYEVPELLALTVDGGSAPYCRWVTEETSEVSA